MCLGGVVMWHVDVEFSHATTSCETLSCLGVLWVKYSFVVCVFSVCCCILQTFPTAVLELWKCSFDATYWPWSAVEGMRLFRVARCSLPPELAFFLFTPLLPDVWYLPRAHSAMALRSPGIRDTHPTKS